MISVRATVASQTRILLVEDDIALRATLAEVLSERGFDVACACDGREALAELASHPAPNLILLDLAMPVMDGWAFRAVQRLDPRYAEIPTVILSASMSSLEGLAPAAALTKPFDLDRLVDTIHRICDDRPLAAVVHEPSRPSGVAPPS